MRGRGAREKFCGVHSYFSIQGDCMYATCIDTCSTLIYINYIHIQVRGGGGRGGVRTPPPASALVSTVSWPYYTVYRRLMTVYGSMDPLHERSEVR